jgi:hypothetical protein
VEVVFHGGSDSAVVVMDSFGEVCGVVGEYPGGSDGLVVWVLPMCSEVMKEVDVVGPKGVWVKVGEVGAFSMFLFPLFMVCSKGFRKFWYKVKK